jgi:hypothetical protein
MEEKLNKPKQFGEPMWLSGKSNEIMNKNIKNIYISRVHAPVRATLKKILLVCRNNVDVVGSGDNLRNRFGQNLRIKNNLFQCIFLTLKLLCKST